ncbi:unnamed protein product [Lactuca virosa]|uniref:Uncharacterized protein n=1 Tax=Lactuca virosa TaxID=75947 RepID=A0AAU9M0J6_9ASTR|nr:unnamed protein product [Lactuca virosa]
MTSISELKIDGIGGPLQVRILRKWKHDVRQYESWYLAVDKFEDAIQILGQRTNQSYIESIFNVSQCYSISDYSCPQLDKYQKFLENAFYIDVGLKSVIEPVPDTIIIPKTWFRFISKSHLIELGETPPYYPDYIGVLSKIRDCTKTNGESFVLLILTDESGSELAINLWKECITNPQKFNRATLHPPLATTVVAVTNLKPSISNGALRHGSSHVTHIYVNPEIPETTALININTLPSIITNHKEQTKMMSIQMLRASTPDNIRFIIIDIEDSTTMSETSVPTTPAPARMTRMRPSDTTPDPSIPVQHVARALTYDPTEPTPRKNAKRTVKQQTS